jgi:hypothetical protein
MEIVIQYFVNSLNMHENVAEGKIKIEDIPEADEWVECIDKTAYQTCNNNRIQLKKSDTNQHTGFIIESNDITALSCIGWAIEKHLDDIPSELRPTFQKILEDTRIKKENLERS